MECNDENAPPNVRPNDDDRLRFGFKKRIPDGRLQRRSQAVVHEPEEEQSADDRGMSGPPVFNDDHISLVRIVERALGDPDEHLKVLRAKRSASKYDFKARLTEISDQNRALRSALMKQREQHRYLLENLSKAELDINWKLRSSAQQATDQAKEREHLFGKLQETIRTAWRDDDEARPKTSCAYQELEEQLKFLRHCCSTEVERASQAALCTRAKEDELAAVRLELSNVREQNAVCEMAARERVQTAKLLVDDAGTLMASQFEDAKVHSKAMREEAAKREHELLTKLDRALFRVRELETKESASIAAGS